MSQQTKILVVDDEAAIRRLLRTALTRAGYRVVEAASAREAWSATQIDKPNAVLLDLGLPDRDGLEIVPLLKSSGAAVIVISARDATEQKVTALDLGADDYIGKPFATEEVLARVRTALRHRLSSGATAPIVRLGDSFSARWQRHLTASFPSVSRQDFRDGRRAMPALSTRRPGRRSGHLRRRPPPQA